MIRHRKGQGPARHARARGCEPGARHDPPERRPVGSAQADGGPAGAATSRRRRGGQARWGPGTGGRRGRGQRKGCWRDGRRDLQVADGAAPLREWFAWVSHCRRFEGRVVTRRPWNLGVAGGRRAAALRQPALRCARFSLTGRRPPGPGGLRTRAGNPGGATGRRRSLRLLVSTVVRGAGVRDVHLN